VSLRIGTAEANSTFLTQGQALKSVLERNASLAPVDVSVSATASVENANRLAADDIDFGFMASNWIGRAKNGEAPFAQKIDLRMVAPMNAGPLFLIARAVGDLRVVTDVRRRRLVVGPQQSGMAQHARVILGALGLTFSDFVPVYLDFAAGADALARREADAQLQCPIPNAVMTALVERTRVRVLPYDRGSMYFAVVDEEVRAASGGKRTLDDLLLAMLDRRRQNLPVDESAWVEMVTKELGEKGKTEFEAMLAGSIQLPEPGGFGPCFTRTTKMLRR